MARYFGAVGFGESVETPPGSGKWSDVIFERRYRGDVIKNSRRIDSGDGVNFDVTVGNSISIVADTYAIEHFLKIRYVEWLGNLWIVTNVTVQRPRLILDLGSVYNGPTP